MWLLPPLLGLLLLLTLWQSRQSLRGRSWLLLRSLFPSWRFFEDVEPGPEATFAVATPGGDFARWQPVLAAAPSRGFFLNAAGNSYLAQQSLVEQLWAELDGVRADDAPRLVPYQLLQRLIIERARELGLLELGGRYKFRLGTDESIDFESEEHAL
jgi:hypothetical protein